MTTEKEKSKVPKEDPLESKKPPMRQVIIETDGSNINLVKNETAGVLELQAVLSTILNKLINTK